jgi:hypothetical protein
LILSELIEKAGGEAELVIRIKTNASDSSGKRIDFIYEIDSIDVLLQAGESKILAITGSLLKQSIR